MLGGVSLSAVFGDLWRLDLATYTWFEVGTAVDDVGSEAPQPSFFHTLVCTHTGELIKFGGVVDLESRTRTNDVHRLDIHPGSVSSLLNTCCEYLAQSDALSPTSLANSDLPAVRLRRRRERKRKKREENAQRMTTVHRKRASTAHGVSRLVTLPYSTFSMLSCRFCHQPWRPSRQHDPFTSLSRNARERRGPLEPLKLLRRALLQWRVDVLLHWHNYSNSTFGKGQSRKKRIQHPQRT